MLQWGVGSRSSHRRLRFAAETIDFSKTDVYDELMALTDHRGPDSCIDAVGCEASGHGATDECTLA
jgi:threonine dehydrogenase-like Zn-dependent dehydrogenase